MRIAFLSVSAGMGGSEASLLELVRGIRRLSPRAQPIVVVPREGPLASRVRNLGGEARVLPMPDALAAFGEWSLRGSTDVARKGAALIGAAGAIAAYQRSLGSLLSTLAPDVIHTNGFKLHVFGTRAAPANVPVVWHIHEYVNRRPLTRRLLRYHASRASAVVANSRSVADDVRSALGAQAPVTTTIYNAVDLDEFAPTGTAVDLDARAQLPPAPPGTIRVGLVATFARWKGHETFLQAIRALDSARVRAYIVGGPVYDTAGSQYTIDEVRALAAGMGVSDRVGFTGFVDRPAEAMRALDVVVHASTEPEPFGLVIAEGLACGRAVVVSAAGGAAELVEDDVDALTFTPGDADALARALARATGDAPLRARLGAAGRQTAVRRFDPEVFTLQFLALYERVSEQARMVAS